MAGENQIRIFYDPADGTILYTVSYDDPGPVPTTGSYINVPEFTGNINEWYVVAEVLTERPDAAARRRPTSLELVRARAYEVRERFITNLPGQGHLLRRKEDEARDWKTNLLAPLGTHPVIEAEIGVTGTTKTEVADAIIAQADAWWSTAASLETIRLTANKSINDATSVVDIEAAMTAFNASMDTLEASL